MALLRVESGAVGVACAALAERAEECSGNALKYVIEGKAELAGDLARLSAAFGIAYLKFKEAKFL